MRCAACVDEAETVGGGVKVVVFLFLSLFSLSVKALWCARVIFRSLPPLIHFSHIFSLLSFSLLLPHTLLTLTSLSLSLYSAGSEHFLLGENLTVAVLGVVIPIGKSPAVFLAVRPG